MYFDPTDPRTQAYYEARAQLKNFFKSFVAAFGLKAGSFIPKSWAAWWAKAVAETFGFDLSAATIEALLELLDIGLTDVVSEETWDRLVDQVIPRRYGPWVEVHPLTDEDQPWYIPWTWTPDRPEVIVAGAPGGRRTRPTPSPAPPPTFTPSGMPGGALAPTPGPAAGPSGGPVVIPGLTPGRALDITGRAPAISGGGPVSRGYVIPGSLVVDSAGPTDLSIPIEDTW